MLFVGYDGQIKSRLKVYTSEFTFANGSYLTPDFIEIQ